MLPCRSERFSIRKVRVRVTGEMNMKTAESPEFRSFCAMFACSKMCGILAPFLMRTVRCYLIRLRVEITRHGGAVGEDRALRQRVTADKVMPWVASV